MKKILFYMVSSLALISSAFADFTQDDIIPTNATAINSGESGT